MNWPDICKELLKGNKVRRTHWSNTTPNMMIKSEKFGDICWEDDCSVCHVDKNFLLATDWIVVGSKHTLSSKRETGKYGKFVYPEYVVKEFIDSIKRRMTQCCGTFPKSNILYITMDKATEIINEESGEMFK